MTKEDVEYASGEGEQECCIGLEKKDAMNRARLRVGVQQIAVKVG